MYMATIATHMSMQDKTMDIADVKSILVIEFGVGASCRGMLAVPQQGRTSGVHGLDGQGGGVEHMPPRGQPGRTDNADAADEAGTSRCAGTRGGRNGGGASSSDAE